MTDSVSTRPLVDRVREWALSRRAWTRAEMVDAIGAPAASSLAGLVARGEIVSPGRGVYALPGVHDEDPDLQSALARGGSALYPVERRIASMTPVERRAAADLRSAGERSRLRETVLAFFAARRVATVPQVREALGSSGAAKLAELAERAQLRRIATGVYAAADVDPDGPEAAAALADAAARDRAVVAAIDAAVADGPPPQRTPPEFAGRAVLRYWEAPGDESRPAIRRVYVEIPNYPVVFGQSSRRRHEGRGGTIAWGSSSPRIGPVQAAALARKVFDPVPVFFQDLRMLVPDGEEASVPLTRRNDAHADMDPADDPAPVSIDERHPLPCAYVVADTRSLDPSRLQHPLPQTVRLLVDHREPASIITELRRVANLDVVRTELEVGDYLVEGRMVVERKSNDDFHQSLAEGANHLMKQVERMSATGLHRVLLVEGGTYARRQFFLNRLVSTESYIRHVHGIHVVPTMNRQHSVYAIVQAIKHQMFGMFSDVHAPDPIDKREIAEDPSRTVRLLLTHLKGISVERADALVDHFGTLGAVAAASIDELREVRGFGPRTASDVHRVFHHRVSAREVAR